MDYLEGSGRSGWWEFRLGKLTYVVMRASSGLDAFALVTARAIPSLLSCLLGKKYVQGVVFLGSNRIVGWVWEVGR